MLVDALKTRRFRKTRATSIHLFGAGKQAIMEKMVHLVTNLTSTAEHCAHYMEASDVVGMYEEVYAAGKACPCGVMIWNDVQKVPAASLSLFKTWFDDNPGHLIKGGLEMLNSKSSARSREPPVEISGVTFILLSHREPVTVSANLKRMSPEEITSSASAVHAWAQKDAQLFDVWPDRVNHVIRHHIPVISMADYGAEAGGQNYDLA
jgi:hypothetical protein